MKYYKTIYINIVSFAITLIIFILINNFQNISNLNKILRNQRIKVEFKTEELDKLENQEKDKKENVNENVNNQERENKSNQSKEAKESVKAIERSEWKLEIPKINVNANIKEGTTKEILDEAIGHFEETAIENGNVGVAAHNRGYKLNYFENLKELKEGDIIKYKHESFEKEYEIISHIIIKDTDFSMLENTRENRITLITCVENEPEYRRCIQAVEREEKYD